MQWTLRSIEVSIVVIGSPTDVTLRMRMVLIEEDTAGDVSLMLVVWVLHGCPYQQFSCTYLNKKDIEHFFS